MTKQNNFLNTKQKWKTEPHRPGTCPRRCTSSADSPDIGSGCCAQWRSADPWCRRGTGSSAGWSAGRNPAKDQKMSSSSMRIQKFGDFRRPGFRRPAHFCTLHSPCSPRSWSRRSGSPRHGPSTPGTAADRHWTNLQESGDQMRRNSNIDFLMDFEMSMPVEIRHF